MGRRMEEEEEAEEREVKGQGERVVEGRESDIRVRRGRQMRRWSCCPDKKVEWGNRQALDAIPHGPHVQA